MWWLDSILLWRKLHRWDFNSEISPVHLTRLQQKKKKFSIGLRLVLDSVTNWLPFSRDETRKQVLQAALKSFRGRWRRKKNCGLTENRAAGEETCADAAVGSVLWELDGKFKLKWHHIDFLPESYSKQWSFQNNFYNSLTGEGENGSPASDTACLAGLVWSIKPWLPAQHHLMRLGLSLQHNNNNTGWSGYTKLASSLVFIWDQRRNWRRRQEGEEGNAAKQGTGQARYREMLLDRQPEFYNPIPDQPWTLCQRLGGCSLCYKSINPKNYLKLSW